MREIKFRAWDKQRNLMIFNGPFLIMPSGTHHVKDFKDGMILWPNVQLMEFTGLRDKNGVEIYEGDILEFVPLHGLPSGPKIRQPVVYFKDAFILKGSGLIPNTFIMEDDAEIIGNIHEHGGLLE